MGWEYFSKRSKRRTIGGSVSWNSLQLRRAGRSRRKKGAKSQIDSGAPEQRGKRGRRGKGNLCVREEIGVSLCGGANPEGERSKAENVELRKQGWALQ